MRILWLGVVAACGGRVDGRELGGAEPPLSDRGLRDCAASSFEDNDGDGEADNLEAWTYDGRGLRVAASRDLYGDGVVELELATTFDDDDRPTETLGTAPVPPSSNEWRETWVYNLDGYLSRYELDGVIVEDDLVTQVIADLQHTWDGDRLALVEDLDAGIDFAYTWAEDGLSAQIASSDGRAESRVWNEDGTLASSEVTDGAGSATDRTDWAYDEEGRLVEVAEDRDGDGAVDQLTTWTWTCD